MNASSQIRQMALIGLMSAITCVLAPFCFPLPISPVPISPGSAIVCFSVLVLGMKSGFASVLIYLLLGAAGLPVFSGFTGGIGKLLGPTGGYLIGYLLLTLFLGFFAERFHNQILPTLLGAFIGMTVLYLFGTVWLAAQLRLDLLSALWMGVIPYLVPDIIKTILAILAGIHLRKRLAQADLI